MTICDKFKGLEKKGLSSFTMFNMFKSTKKKFYPVELGGSKSANAQFRSLKGDAGVC